MKQHEHLLNLFKQWLTNSKPLDITEKIELLKALDDKAVELEIEIEMDSKY